MPVRIHLRATWVWPALFGAIIVVLLTAGASAAIETRTVTSYWYGLWWSVSLITTVGFIGEPPDTTAGAVLSAILMVFGFLLLAMVSAALAALFVSAEEQPHDRRDEANEQAILAALASLERRLTDIETLLGRQQAD